MVCEEAHIKRRILITLFFVLTATAVFSPNIFAADIVIPLSEIDQIQGEEIFQSFSFASPDNKTFVVPNAKEKSLTIYDSGAWQTVTILKGSYGAFTTDGKSFIVQNQEGNSISLYDTATWQVADTMADRKVSIEGGNLKIVSPATVTFYDTATWKEIKTFAETYGWFSPDGKTAIIWNSDAKTVTFYDTATWKEIKTFAGNYGYFSPDSKTAEIRNSDAKTVTFYDTATWKEIKTFAGADTYGQFSPDSKTAIIWNSDAKTVTFYDTATRKDIKTFTGTSGVFSSDGKTAVITNYDAKTVTFYDTTTWKDIKTFAGTSGYFSPDGKTAMIVNYDAKTITFYDTATWKDIKTFAGTSGLFSPDGKTAIIWNSDAKTVIFYDAAIWKDIKTFAGNYGWFSSDGKTAIIVNYDAKTVTFYDTATRKDIKTFTGTSGGVSSDGKTVSVSKSKDDFKLPLYKPISLKPAVIFKKGEFETSKEYENRLSGIGLPYVFSASLGNYDADRGGFEGNIKNTKFFALVPREKAKVISGRKDKAIVEGILRYHSPESVLLTNATLVDIKTHERFALLKTRGDTVVAYAPKPVIKEAAIENIHDIPDFKSPPRENDIAVIIGIEKYRSIPKSDYSRSDAELMKDYLKAIGFQERNISFLPDEQASLSDIKKTIETWLPNRVKKESRVVIYYSGHGAPEPKSGDGYMVPFDGDPNYLEDTGYSLKRFYDKLGKLQAAEVVVLLDSCFSGAGGRSVLAKGARPLVMMAEVVVIPQNIAVLTATQGSQISTSSPEKGHGVFTYYFLKALRDGKKNIAEIYEYIKPMVEDEAKQLNVQQSPSISPDVEKLKGRFGLRK